MSKYCLYFIFLDLHKNSTVKSAEVTQKKLYLLIMCWLGNKTQNDNTEGSQGLSDFVVGGPRTMFYSDDIVFRNIGLLKIKIITFVNIK